MFRFEDRKKNLKRCIKCGSAKLAAIEPSSISWTEAICCDCQTLHVVLLKSSTLQDGEWYTWATVARKISHAPVWNLQ